MGGTAKESAHRVIAERLDALESAYSLIRGNCREGQNKDIVLLRLSDEIRRLEKAYKPED